MKILDQNFILVEFTTFSSNNLNSKLNCLFWSSATEILQIDMLATGGQNTICPIFAPFFNQQLDSLKARAGVDLIRLFWSKYTYTFM